MSLEIDDPDVRERLWKAFQPESAKQASRVVENNVRFCHYTTAESAMKIFESCEMLLRNSLMMNDFSEVQYGLNCLIHAYESEDGKRLQALRDSVVDGLSTIFADNFNALIDDMRHETYTISTSEHGNEEAFPLEEDLGKLSMWRAYAPKDGVAFVFNNKPFMSESLALNAFTCPVIYTSLEGYSAYFKAIVDGIESEIELLKELGGAFFHESLSNSFRLLVQSTKHPAFREEREWRVVFSPTVLAKLGQLDDAQQSKTPTKLLTIRGVPQRVYSIPFKDYPDEGFEGATIPDLIEKILIGPSVDAFAIGHAMASELTRLEVQEAAQRITFTHIPLRT